MITRKKVIRSIAAAIALAGALLMICGRAVAQDTASIVILPSATPSASDQVVARITYAMAQCGNFAPPTVTRESGGVIRLRVVPVRPAIPVPSCVVTFDVNLGMFPEGNYYVLFEPGNEGVLATASFWVGVAPIPTISEAGIVILAVLIAVLGAMGGAGAERKAVGRRQLGLLLAGWLTLVGTPGSVSTAVAADVAPRATLTEIIVRFDRRVETRSVPEIVDAVNASRDALLSSRLLGPSAARRLLWHEPTEYEREIIAKYPTALLSQLFEFVVLRYDHLPDLDVVADALRRSGSIRSVERVQAFRPAAVDPLLGSPGQSSDVSQWGLHALFIPTAWNKTKGRATIAYLDGGLATSHGDLQSSYRPHLSRNLTTNGISSDLEDNWVFNGIPYQGHGTHVAGILAATNDNGMGVSGACPKCSLVAVKDSALTNVGLVNGIKYALAAGAQIFNLSGTFSDPVGSCTDPYSPSEQRSWCLALGYAHEPGCRWWRQRATRAESGITLRRTVTV